MQTEVEESAGPPGISRAEAVDRLRAAWRQSDDLATLSHHLRTLLEPEADDDGLVVLEFAAREGSFAATDELVGLWERWPALDLLWRQALVRSLARRARAEPPVLALLQQRVLERAEIGEVLVSLFLAAPHWFAENGSAILAAYPHAKPAIVAAGQLLLASVENPNIPGASNASRRMLGELLDYDSAEVFDKLDAMLDAAHELGEALILEMASRQMDLRGVVVALRDRMSRDVIKGAQRFSLLNGLHHGGVRAPISTEVSAVTFHFTECRQNIIVDSTCVSLPTFLVGFGVPFNLGLRQICDGHAI